MVLESERCFAILEGLQDGYAVLVSVTIGVPDGESLTIPQMTVFAMDVVRICLALPSAHC